MTSKAMPHMRVTLLWLTIVCHGLGNNGLKEEVVSYEHVLACIGEEPLSMPMYVHASSGDITWKLRI